MTNTETCDVEATVAQIRCSRQAPTSCACRVPTMEAAEAFGRIRSRSVCRWLPTSISITASALRVAELGVDCLRINPGNIGREDCVRAVVDAARDRGISIRIGVNAGSLEKDLQSKYGEPTAEALVESARVMSTSSTSWTSRNQGQSQGVRSVHGDRGLSPHRRPHRTAPHLGITEAGALRSGTVKSAIGIGMLLSEGIGDTIRISLAADPVEEIKVGFDILKSLHLRSRGINLIACPSCSRQQFDVIATVNALEARLEDIREPLDVAVIGCVVNGPGEAREAHIGLTGGSPHLVFVDGVPNHKVASEQLLDDLERTIRGRIAAQKATAEKSAS